MRQILHFDHQAQLRQRREKARLIEAAIAGALAPWSANGMRSTRAHIAELERDE